jgi:hypothetical protein
MIGTTIAILGAAAIAGGASAMAAHSQKSAINKATNAATANQSENNALAREFYGKNLAVLDPFRDQGLRAGATLSELLGLSPAGSAATYGQAVTPAPTAGGGFPGTGGGATVTPQGSGFPSMAMRLLGGRDAASGFSLGDIDRMGGSASPFGTPGIGGGTYTEDGVVYDKITKEPLFQVPAGMAAPGGVTSPAPTARSAWDTFRDSTNYQFRLGEGERALNQGWAAKGALQSGAAAKALLRYGQDYASNELGNYMNLLGGQQNMGLNAARAVAGVGGDLVQNVTANNNAATGAVANGALARGSATAGMWGDIGSSLGRAVGALGGSSFGAARNPYGIANGGGGIY